MGMVSVDLIVRTALETAMAHLRQNQWLYPDVWGSYAEDPIASVEYGWKEVQRAIDFFNAQDIPVVLPFRNDKPRIPALTVAVQNDGELESGTTLGDEGEEDDDFDPKKNALLPQYVYRPFSPKAYDSATGIVTFPDDLDTRYIVPGQFYVAKRSGKAYQIYKKIGETQFAIKPGTTDDFTGGYVTPPTSLWNAKKERTRMSYTITIGAHAGDPAHATWLKMMLEYILLRYKEAYLEERGLDLTTFQSGPVDLNPAFGGSDKVYSSYVTMTGSIETTWIKYVAPKLMGVNVSVKIIDGPKTPKTYFEQVKKQGWRMQADPPNPSTKPDDPYGLEEGIATSEGLGENESKEDHDKGEAE